MRDSTVININRAQLRREQRGWHVVVTEFHNGVPWRPRRCARCGAPKLRGRSQYCVRWSHRRDEWLEMEGYTACSPDCVHEIAMVLERRSPFAGTVPEFSQRRRPTVKSYREFTREHTRSEEKRT